MSPRKEGDPNPNQEIYAPYCLRTVIEAALEQDSAKWRQMQEFNQTAGQEIQMQKWGKVDSAPIYLHPSTISNCLRWAGYQFFKDEYSPATLSPEVEMILMMGSAAHSSLERKLYPLGGSVEQQILSEKAHLMGKLDLLLRNPLTGEWQIVDFKFVSSFAFRKNNRDELPKYLRNTKDICNPSPQHRLQVLLYMWAKRQEGLDVACGNIIYINRDNGIMKEALVPWDALAEYEINEFIGKMQIAVEKIKNGELPEPSVVTPYICGKLCPFRGYCDFGQKFGREVIKRAGKRRAPNWVSRQIKQEQAEKKQRMEMLGVVQPRLLE